MEKIRVAIYDFSDCEGCEVKLVSLRDRLLKIATTVDVVNWRLTQERLEPGPYDLTIIEGAPITKHEIELLKELRESSKLIVGLGSCATLGGVLAIMDKKNREKYYKIIYGDKYSPRGVDSLPLSAYVPVDYLIHGCPVDGDVVVGIIEDLLAGKKLKYKNYSVCYECKLAKNKCRLINKEPCLGPITQGGCGAICVKGGSPCYGCFGFREKPNIKALLKILNNITSEEEIERYFTMFLKATPEYKKYFNKTND